MNSIVAQDIRNFGAAVPFAIAVTFSDGTTYRNRDEPARFTIHFRDRAVEWAIAAFGHVGMIEGYIDGTIDIDGDLYAAFQAGLDGNFASANSLVAQRNRWHEFKHSNASRAQAKENARTHYGLGTEFYRLWLDAPYMMYTCAYWPEGTLSLEQAQVNDVAREIERRGFAQQLKVIEADFRDVPGMYDKVISIGVLEHAGRDQLADVVKAHAQCLKPGGLGMLHFIGHVGRRDTEYFIRESATTVTR